MVACSVSRAGVVPRDASRHAANKRLAVAILASVALHTFLANSTSGGPGRRGSEIAELTPLTVRLVPVTPAEVMETLAEAPKPREPMPRSAPERPPKIRQTTPASSSTDTGDASGPTALPDATYYAARQLDVYPALTAPVDLRYSARAAAAGVKGKALLLLLIDSQGVVEDVSIVEAEPGGYIEDDARRAFVSARFTPALKNGRAVKSRVLVEVNYGEAPAP